MALARLWKNGTVQPLEGSEPGSRATGVAISGGEVYVAGGVWTPTGDRAVYWRNGALVALTDGSRQAFAEAIAVRGRDVYVAGYERFDLLDVATLWVNGVAHRLTGAAGSANALAVAVSGDDVFVAGYEIEATPTGPRSVTVANVAKVWKNGVATALSDGLEPALAHAVAVIGGDLYVAGRAGSGSLFVATLWKNGVPLPLADPAFGSAGRGLSAADGDVLVAGLESDGLVPVAKLWRNGVPVDLTSADRWGFATPAEARAVATVGGEPYVAGWHGLAAVYWRDGGEVRLTDGSREAEAHAIAVALH